MYIVYIYIAFTLANAYILKNQYSEFSEMLFRQVLQY